MLQIHVFVVIFLGRLSTEGKGAEGGPLDLDQ